MVNDLPTVRDFDFPGKDPGEQVQFYFRRHWIKLLKHIGKYLLISIALLGGMFSITVLLTLERTPLYHTFLITVVLIFAGINLLLVVKLYRNLLWVTIVTDKRIHWIHKSLLLRNQHQTIDLWLLEDISMKQRGFLQNLLGYGSLIIVLQSKDVGMTLWYVPAVTAQYRHIMLLREKARQWAPQPSLYNGSANSQGAPHPTDIYSDDNGNHSV